MSRFEKHNARFAVAYGVDHLTGAYCQVWAAPMEKQEHAFLIIDNRGVHAGDARPKGVEIATREWLAVNALLAEIRARFRQANDAGIAHPNIDYQTVARLFALFGFEGMESEVFRAFD